MDSDADPYYDDSDDLFSDEEEAPVKHGGDGDSQQKPKHYTIVKEERIRKLQENDIVEVSTLLSVSRGTACTLLRRTNWCPTSVFDEWFADEESVRLELGLLPDQKSSKPNNKNNNILCNICFEQVKIDNTSSASCGHPFCLDCWKSLLSVSINDGPGCLALTCPDPGCKSNPGLDMVDKLASEKDKHKYYGYLLRSYIDGHRNLKWCPAPGCDLAVKMDSGERENYDVKCDCSLRFCWNCTEECHRPVSCETVEKWIKQNNSEAENTTWILAFTKPCPKCHRNIEKNQGCNHMTCRSPCNFHFCWLCLQPLNTSHNCNRFKEDEQSKKVVQDARNRLRRYAHYYERWALNQKSRKAALSNLKRARTELVGTLEKAQNVAGSDLKFVIEALEQIVECRRVLKWTYAYGYFLSMDDMKGAKMNLFEYLQGEAEGVLERLHHCVEKEMDKYVKTTDCPSDEFRGYRKKLIDLTNVTKTYFENLVGALENDLCEVTDTKKRSNEDSEDWMVKVSKVGRRPKAGRLS